MMALRADMTAQMAAYFRHKIGAYPAPLKAILLWSCYAGCADVLNPERQMVQAGAELIGSSDAYACAEMIGLGVRALNQAGIEGLTVDIIAFLIYLMC